MQDIFLNLTNPQKTIWNDQANYINSPIYNVGGYEILRGDLEMDFLVEAISLTIENNDSLQLILEEQKGIPYQSIRLIYPYQIIKEDFSHENNAMEFAKNWIKKEMNVPFKLQNNPLYKFFIIKIKANNHILFTKYHHLICDGWSGHLIHQTIVNYYNGLKNNAILEKQTLSYVSFIEGDKSPRHNPSEVNSLWNENNLPTVPSLFNEINPHTSGNHYETKRETIAFHRSTINNLRLLKDTDNIDLLQVFTSLVFLFMQRIFERDTIIFMVPCHNRSTGIYKKMTGMFMKTVPLKIGNEDTNATFKDLCNIVRKGLIQAYKHSKYDLTQLNNISSLLCLNDIFINYRPYQLNTVFDGLKGERHTIGNDYGKFRISFEFNDYGIENDLVLNIDYDKNSFDRIFIQNITDYLENSLENFRECCLLNVCKIPIINKKEFERIIFGFNNTDVAAQHDNHVILRFKKSVAAYGDRIAIKYNSNNITYSELETTIEKISSKFLNSFKLKKGDSVAVMIDHGWEIIPIILAIMRSGCVYIPINPENPTERINLILNECKPTIIITTETLRELVPEPFIHLAVMLNELFLLEENIIFCPVILNHISYVIYTSGSTGQPKGVMVSHNNLSNFILAMDEVLSDTTPQDKWLNLTSISFDISILELLWPLCNGQQVTMLDRKPIALLRIAPEFQYLDELKEKASVVDESLADIIERDKITHIQCTPSLANLLIQNEPFAQKIKELNRWLIGGEVLPPQLVKKIHAISSIEILNMYGPTETTIWSAYSTIKKDQEITIGKPLANTYIYILDKFLQPLPAGVAGNLFISGLGVSDGYINRLELTATKFIDDPFRKGLKMYNTGDTAAWSVNGELIFKGRKDSQIKWRGYRIELDEIAHFATELNSVSEAVAIFNTAVNEWEQELVLYVTGKLHLDTDEIAKHLSEYLPSYMMPSIIIQIEEIPKTHNGKTDITKLYVYGSMKKNTGSLPENFNINEEVLLKIWKNVLKEANISVTDNFFHIGGDSIKAMLLISLMRKNGMKIEVRDLFTHPTIQLLIPIIKLSFFDVSQERITGNVNLTPIHHSISETPVFVQKKDDQLSYDDYINNPIKQVPPAKNYPLSMHQSFIFNIEKNIGIKNYYHEPRAVYINGELNIEFLISSFELIVQKHEILRTHFGIENENISQIIDTKTSLCFSIIDLKNIVNREALITEYVNNEFKEPFNLFTGPLLRIKLLILEHNRYLLLLTTHHIISDGWSMGVFLREFIANYNNFKSEYITNPQALEFQYKDFAQWINKLVQSNVLTEQRKYWLTKLNGKLSRLNLPADFDKNEETSFLGNEITFRLSDHEMKMLTQLSIKHNTTLYMNFLAIVSHVLFELTRQRDILVGTPVTGRIHPSLENQVGLYVNYVVLRTEILEVEKINTFFKNIKETVIGAFENQIYPFPWLVGEVDYEYNPLYNPLFDVLVMEKINEGEITGMNGVSIEWYKQKYILSRYDLCFYINNYGGYLEINIKYKKELFFESTIEKIKFLFLGTLFTFSND